VTVLRSAFAAAAVPASWFALLLGVPLAAASWGWTPLATGLLLVPAALVGFVSPPIARRLLARLGGRRTIALACPTAVVALLIAALGGALESPWLLALAVVLVTIAFGVGQPAMISSVGAAVPGAQRGVALGIATLVFLTGASVGAALVGGLSSVIGVPAAFCLLIALPVLGIVALLIGGPDRVEPATAG
jgi:MFS family permease